MNMMTRRKLYSSVIRVALTTLVLWSVPCIAMRVTPEVVMGTIDFVVAGMAYTWITRRSTSSIYHVAMGVSIAATFLMLWANLAVDLMGSRPGGINLMYVAVICSGNDRSRAFPVYL